MVGMSDCSADMAVAESSATSVGSDPLVTGGLPEVHRVRRVSLCYQNACSGFDACWAVLGVWIAVAVLAPSSSR